ncbi:MAG: FAD:protein FMN transferase [Methylococcales bacterium]
MNLKTIAGLVRSAFAFLVFAFVCWACSDPNREAFEFRYFGTTMGTTFAVKIPKLPQGLDKTDLKKAIDDTLIEVNSILSTYQVDSELSRLNRNPSTEWIVISAQLAEVLDQALEISRLSDGAYDVTVGPLVNLWGFGPGNIDRRVPEPTEIQALLNQCGYQKIHLNAQKNAVKKDLPNIYIDLSSIAQGYGVDRIAQVISGFGIDDYLVEISGEIRVHGKSPDAGAWTIGIEKPVADQRSIEETIQIAEGAVATSGDYRNFFEVEGIRYSHTIDPKSGWPISHGLASVTVLEKSATRADGLATAFMVLGTDAGLRLAEQHRIAALFIQRNGAGFVKRASREFPVESE